MLSPKRAAEPTSHSESVAFVLPSKNPKLVAMFRQSRHHRTVFLSIRASDTSNGIMSVGPQQQPKADGWLQGWGWVRPDSDSNGP
jgi:hypothetical protein